MLGSVVGGLGGAIGSIAVLAGAAGKGGKDEYKKAIAILNAVKDPNFDISQLSAPELRIFAEYFPETYKAVVPEGYQGVSEGPEGRAAQVRSLATFERMRDEGLPLAERLAAQEAGRGLQGEMAGANQMVRRDLAQRGRLGGGEATVQSMMANQSAADLANRLGNSLVQQALQNRMAGAAGAAGLGGQMRGQDVDLSRLNAEYANRFNEMRTGRQNEAAQYAAQMANQANLYNTQARQGVGEANIMNAYQNRIRNQEYPNLMKQQTYEDAFRKAAAVAGATQDLGRQKELERAEKIQQIMGIGQGLGQAVGGGLDIAGGAGAFGPDLQSTYRRRYY